jgi:hypothetical protein
LTLLPFPRQSAGNLTKENTMSYHAEQFSVDDITVTIHYDEEPMSPRDWDNLGVMWCSHRDYTLGDDRLPNHIDSMSELVEYVKKHHGATVVLPLYLLDHSGLSMRAGSPSPFDPGGWDTSLVGVIFDTEDTRRECGTPLDLIEEVLRSEVEIYSMYLEGRVYGYVIQSPDGDEDSCWSYYDIDQCREDARSEAEALSLEYRERQRLQARDEAIRFYDNLATYAFAG